MEVAQAGLLDGQECTTHWMHSERLAGTFPQAQDLAIDVAYRPANDELGFGGDTPSEEEIGSILGITESRVCQIHTKAVGGLRGQLTEVD